MPYEVADGEGLRKIPDLNTAQWIFSLKQNPGDAELKSKLIEEIKTQEGGPLYEYVCKELKLPVDSTLLASLNKKNKETLAGMDSAISDAKENLGESEVRAVNYRNASLLYVLLTLPAVVKSYLPKNIQELFYLLKYLKGNGVRKDVFIV